jgi:outer membrane lipoprotein-sorting protein
MRFRRRSLLAWCVPAGLVVSIAAIAAAPQLVPAGADPVPNLPQLTPAELLVKVRTANVQTLSGNVSLTTNLGLPDLGSFGSFGGGGTGSLLDYLSGSHSAQVWADGPDHLRVAVPTQGAESDWIRNGSDLWAWDSRTQTATHTTIPAGAEAPTPPDSAEATLTPEALAQQVLALIDPSTIVSVQTPGYVAGRPVYELVLEPRTTTSTVGSVTVAVDAATGAPLRTEVTARGQSSAAIDLTFTSISFDQPDSSVFAFTPPPGSTVAQASSPAGMLGMSGDGEVRHQRAAAGAPGQRSTTKAPSTPTPPTESVTTVGTDWSTIAVISGMPLGGELQSILQNAPAVSGPAGSGHLITTALLNVLVLDDGRVAVGAVTPDALQAAVPPR